MVDQSIVARFHDSKIALPCTQFVSVSSSCVVWQMGIGTFWRKSNYFAVFFKWSLCLDWKQHGISNFLLDSTVVTWPSISVCSSLNQYNYLVLFVHYTPGALWCLTEFSDLLYSFELFCLHYELMIVCGLVKGKIYSLQYLFVYTRILTEFSDLLYSFELFCLHYELMIVCGLVKGKIYIPQSPVFVCIYSKTTCTWLSLLALKGDISKSIYICIEKVTFPNPSIFTIRLHWEQYTYNNYIKPDTHTSRSRAIAIATSRTWPLMLVNCCYDDRVIWVIHDLYVVLECI